MFCLLVYSIFYVSTSCDSFHSFVAAASLRASSSVFCNRRVPSSICHDTVQDLSTLMPCLLQLNACLCAQRKAMPQLPHASSGQSRASSCGDATAATSDAWHMLPVAELPITKGVCDDSIVRLHRQGNLMTRTHRISVLFSVKMP